MLGNLPLYLEKDFLCRAVEQLQADHMVSISSPNYLKMQFQSII
jgi:hypothetical protein